jgi:putative CRISPR-associated protein (TIGR02619 family)
MVILDKKVCLMSRIIITTCGTSLFKSCCWKYYGLCNDSLSEMKDKQDRMQYELVCNSKLKEALEEDYDLSKEFEPFSWENPAYMRDLPAELASLSAIKIYLDNNQKGPLGNGDKVILLHSDNKEGSFCANVIYNVLKENNLLPGVVIEKWPIIGLDPSDAERFGSALLEIWQKSINKFEKNENDEYIFNLTGGYKGVAILLGAFAYINKCAKIFYLYEETNYEKITIMFFDPNSTIPGINEFKVGYFDVESGKGALNHLPSVQFD